MDKEEILEKSREENKDQDLAEMESLKQAGKIAFLIGCGVCVVICALQWSFTQTVNWGCWVVNFSILGTVFLVKFIQRKKVHELLTAIMYYALCGAFAAGFIMSLLG
ncbi:MAG TPA: DUF6442 family protein [Candidatus Limiplasma sp.]|nr:DUF6442 family protein [Candidatus Limiplasma sp.]